MKYENRMTDEQWKMIMTIDDDITDKEDMQERWKMNEDRRYAERHDIFPEDDTVGRITICR